MPRRGINLSEEQWRIVKAHAAKRGQTMSEFFADVVMDLGLGRAPGKDYPPAMVEGGIEGRIDESHIAEDGTRVIDKVSVTGASFSPAPKPARKR